LFWFFFSHRVDCLFALFMLFWSPNIFYFDEVLLVTYFFLL
jgi:hypothetical protein